MKTAWPIVVLILGMLGALSFLVYAGKLDSTLLISLVSAITGGGLLHQGWASANATQTTTPPEAPQAAPEPPPAPAAPE